MAKEIYREISSGTRSCAPVMPIVLGKCDLLKGPQVVVIDDDKSVRSSMVNLIQALGYSVDAFDSAEAFLDSNTIQTTSCLITDVQMPGMNGVELQRYLSAAGHRMPIIFMTAHPTDAMRACVIENGAIGYLSKPLREQALLTCLDKAFNLDL